MGTEDKKITSQVYKGGNIFCDTDSSKIILYNKVSFTAEDIIMPKLKFEREEMGAGVPLERYSTDNSIYTSKEFTRELNGKGK